MKNLKSVFIIANLIAKEWLRLKFFHVVLFIAFLFIIFSHLISTLTFAVQERIFFDFGLAGLELGLIFISCLIGAHAIHREIERKTLFLLLVRPLPRWTIIVGAWGALFLLNFVFIIGFSLSFLTSSGVIGLFKGLILGLISAFLKALVISSFALSMGLIVRPLLALAISMSYWILCYSIPNIEFFVEKLKSDSLIIIVSFLDNLIPQFYRFNWGSYYFMNHIPNSSEIFWMAFHCISWTFFWLFTASLFFQRKEIV